MPDFFVVKGSLKTKKLTIFYIISLFFYIIMILTCINGRDLLHFFHGNTEALSV